MCACVPKFQLYERFTVVRKIFTFLKPVEISVYQELQWIEEADRKAKQ